MKQMMIIKRSGQEVPFDITKIEDAIRKASNAVNPTEALSEDRIKLIAKEVAGVCEARACARGCVRRGDTSVGRARGGAEGCGGQRGSR